MRKVSLLKISNPRFYARDHARTKAVGTVATDKPSCAIRRTLSLWHESCYCDPLRLRAVGDSEVGRPTRAEESASWLMMVGEEWKVSATLDESLEECRGVNADGAWPLRVSDSAWWSPNFWSLRRVVQASYSESEQYCLV